MQKVLANSPEDVAAYLRAALELTEAIAPPPDLRAVFFTAAVNLTSASVLLQNEPQVVPLPPALAAGLKRH